MKAYRIVGILIIVAAGIAAFCNSHKGPQASSKYPEIQSLAAEFGAADRPDPRQMDDSTGRSGQPDQDSQFPGDPNAADPAPEAAAPYNQDSYDSVNSATTVAVRSTQVSATLDPSSWTRQTGGDNSATVQLPPNWRLSNIASGTTIVEGPDKEQVVLGFQTFVTPGTQNYAPYMGPEQALQWFTRTRGVQLVRILDRAPAGQGNQGGQAELISFETQLNGVRYKALALVKTNPMQMNTWQFYLSCIGAPEGQFDAEAPIMKSIWQSWKLNSSYVQNSFNDAQRRVNDTAATMNQHILRNQRNNANINAGFDQAINGVNTMRNDSTGQRYDVPIGSEQQFINNCVRRGQDCHQVPTDQLVQPQ
jgi:hypothetical protein